MAVGEGGGGGSALGPIVKKSWHCACVVLGKKAVESFFFAKITCTEGGLQEGLIVKVTLTLGYKMEVQYLRCAYVHPCA
jgi:hypothetical protein